MTGPGKTIRQILGGFFGCLKVFARFFDFTWWQNRGPSLDLSTTFPSVEQLEEINSPNYLLMGTGELLSAGGILGDAPCTATVDRNLASSSSHRGSALHENLETPDSLSSKSRHHQASPLIRGTKETQNNPSQDVRPEETKPTWQPFRWGDDLQDPLHAAAPFSAAQLFFDPLNPEAATPPTSFAGGGDFPHDLGNSGGESGSNAGGSGPAPPTGDGGGWRQSGSRRNRRGQQR